MQIRNVVLSYSFLALVGAVNLAAQSTFGTIVGTVKDASSALIPDVEIHLLNVDENTTRDTRSDNQGLYQFINVLPGQYVMTAEKNGFGVVRIADMRLDARQERRTDVVLTVAAVSQTVEVSAQATTVNTENGTIAHTMNSRLIAELPANYRGATTSPLAAIVSLPGVQQDASGNISVGGAQSAQMTDYSVDGINSNAIRSNGGFQNVYPSSELLDEFKVSAVNNNAEMGSVGDVTITTKSGSNTLHGSAFEYLQNRDLDATTYGSTTKQAKVWNTFGGSFGGPRCDSSPLPRV